MSNALLLGYGLDQPSYRHRMRSLIGPLETAGWQVRAEHFPSGRYGLRTWERRALLRWADVVVLHQIKLSAPAPDGKFALTLTSIDVVFSEEVRHATAEAAFSVTPSVAGSYINHVTGENVLCLAFFQI